MLVVVLLLTCSMPINAFAASSALNYEQENFYCQVYENKNVFLNNYKTGSSPTTFTQTANNHVTTGSNLSIRGEGTSVTLQLSIDGQTQTFTGALYPVVGGGYYDDKLVLGDFSESNDYNVVSFRIEKFPSLSTATITSTPEITLSLVLEKLNDNTVYDVSIALTELQFDRFHQIATEYYETLNIEPDTDEYLDMMRKIMSLMQISKNWNDNQNAAEPLAWATPFEFDSITTANNGVAVSRATLNSFFTQMDLNGTTGYKYSSSSTMGRVLNQLGWKVYHNKDEDAPYFYLSYGVDNSGFSRLVQLILCGYSSDYVENSGSVETHLEVYGSVLVEWDKFYDIENCKIVYYSGGPELTDVYLCASELAGTNTIFTHSTVTFSLYQNRSAWAGFLISRIPKYGPLIVDIWDSLAVSSTTEASPWGKGYEVTVSAQEAAGGLIKDVCSRSGTASLVSKGNNMHLVGAVNGTFYSCVTKFMFTAENMI